MKHLKYLASFSIPIAAVIGLVYRDHWVFLTPVFAFVMVPILEILLPTDAKNNSMEEQISRSQNAFFDLLLYANVPIVYGIVCAFLATLATASYSPMEVTGLTISVGIVLGGNGINVAHELGHRKTLWEKTLGKLLLLPALYMHFYIEHNFGHHKNAATAEDPASASYNQTVYSFWFTSVFRQYLKSWIIQKELLERENKSFVTIKNDMLWYTLFQISYLLGVYLYFGSTGLFVAIGIATISVLLLETINYIEHYGLRRNKNKTGRYERVAEIHSWNSNHVLGRIMLYELTRHSDHHYRSHKKYQLLDCHETSPQMPFGYPTSMVLAMVPPLWFSIMNKRIPVEMRS